MDFDDYYFRSKNSKHRRYEGTCRRKGQTIRNRILGPKGKSVAELVSKTIKTTEYWDEERINEYCENILEDGGMPPRAPSYIGEALSMKKHKRWNLSSKVREAMFREIENDQAPNILLVERAVGPCDYPMVSSSRANATRATFVGKQASGNRQSEEESRNRIVVDRKGNHKYSYPEDLTGCQSVRQMRYQRESKENERPQIIYDFCYASPPDRCPGDMSGDKTCGYRYETKRHKHYEEIEEYYYAQKNGDDWSMDDDNYGGAYPEDEDTETASAEVQRSTEVTMETLIQSSKDGSRKKKKKRNQKNRESPNTEISGRKNMKGKLVRVAETESCFPLKGDLEDSFSPATTISFEIERCALENFINAQRERAGQNLVEIANLRPISFTADLRPQPINEIQHEPCHLVFKTDFDPDAFEQHSIKEYEYNVIDVILICGSDELSKLIAENLKESAKKLDRAEEASDLGVFILGAKRIVEGLWCDMKELYSQEYCTQAKKDATGACTPQEIRRNRISCAMKGISEQAGLDVEYYSREALQPNDIMTERDGFEFVSNLSTPDYCLECKTGFKANDGTGIALASCGHWFCVTCWVKHMKKSDEFFLECIEVGCPARANMAAKQLFCFLAGSPISKALIGKERDRIAYKCPISSCQQVTMVKASVIKPPAIWCPCRKSWCADCGADPHWPASCAAARRYAIEHSLLKRKSLFESVKVCPKCREVTLPEEPRGLHWHRPEFDFSKNCWVASKEGSPFYSHKRLPHWHHCWGEVDDAVPQSLFFVDGLQFDKETIEANHKVFKKHHDPLWSNEFDMTSRSRANEYLTKMGKQNLMTVVEDLLLTKNQLHHVLLYIHVTLHYDKEKASNRTKFLVGMSKKMDVLVERINYLLLKRDYQSRDSLFPTTYQTLATKGKRMIRDLFQVNRKAK